MSTSRIPPLLEPYLSALPESSLVLLTGVLGASTNWFVLRWLYSLLRNAGGRGQQQDGDGEAEEQHGVVLVSFLRDGAFWREGGVKLGLDLDGLAKAGRFVFVDGLTGLFTDTSTASSSSAATPALPARSGSAGGGSQRVIQGNEGLEGVKNVVDAALAQLKTEKKVLILDQPDALLAASGEDVGSQRVQDLLLRLRENVHATVLTLAADDPLTHTQQTTLEKEHAALLAGQAHAADGWAGVRMLDTGVARDVSGVVRFARRAGGAFDEDEGEKSRKGNWEERDMLYWVGADGGVKVFERGTA